jgi:8-oxo-dGTP diphosphatase
MDNKKNIIVGVKGVIINNGKVLIVKRSAHSHVGGGSWECVGGKLEFGETLEEALIREAKEEAGIRIIVKSILYATTFLTNSSRQVVLNTYLCKTEDTEVTLSNEHSDFCWATKNELDALLSTNIIKDFEQYGVFQLDELQS